MKKERFYCVLCQQEFVVEHESAEDDAVGFCPFCGESVIAFSDEVDDDFEEWLEGCS